MRPQGLFSILQVVAPTLHIDWDTVRSNSAPYSRKQTYIYTGIGLEGHEEPYIRGGSLDVIKIGHTFSNEPGIYIEGKVSCLC